MKSYSSHLLIFCSLILCSLSMYIPPPDNKTVRNEQIEEMTRSVFNSVPYERPYEKLDIDKSELLSDLNDTIECFKISEEFDNLLINFKDQTYVVNKSMDLYSDEVVAKIKEYIYNAFGIIKPCVMKSKKFKKLLNFIDNTTLESYIEIGLIKLRKLDYLLPKILQHINVSVIIKKFDRVGKALGQLSNFAFTDYDYDDVKREEKEDLERRTIRPNLKKYPHQRSHQHQNRYHSKRRRNLDKSSNLLDDFQLEGEFSHIDPYKRKIVKNFVEGTSRNNY